jgi:hypothetical protein
MKIFIGPYRNYNKRTKKTMERKINIRIDRYDTWSMDHTLAMIIVPMLKQLRNTAHGAPFVEITDVPKNLRPTAKQIERYDHDGKTDPKFFERWNWILDEMIWSFEQELNDDWEQQYVSGKTDNLFQALDKDGKNIGKPVKLRSKKKDPKGVVSWRMIKGPNDTYKIDEKGRTKHYDRIKNGHILFGKYFNSLWD